MATMATEGAITTKSGFTCHTELEARGRMRDLWREIEDIDLQLATRDRSAPGFWEWRNRAKFARAAKVRERAELKEWAYARYTERRARLDAGRGRVRA